MNSGTRFDVCSVCGATYEDYEEILDSGGGWCTKHDGPAHPGSA